MEYYSSIAIANRLCKQQTFHTIQIVIHNLVTISNINPKPFKVPFKSQPIALGF